MKIRKVLIVVAVLFLSIVLFFGMQIANYLNKMEESDTTIHAEEACMPQYAFNADLFPDQRKLLEFFERNRL